MNAVAAEAEDAPARGVGSVDEALTHLQEAQAILDALGVAADVGAVLQDVIARLERHAAR